MRIPLKYRTALATVLLLSGEGCLITPAHLIPDGPDGVAVTLRFRADESASKSGDPDGNLISDVNLFLFSPDGFLTDRLWFRGSERALRLPRYEPFSLYAVANVGFELDGIRTLDELRQWRYYLIYPDDFRRGLPRACIRERILIGDEGGPLDVPMPPLLVRLTLSMDRTALDPDVRVSVRSAVVGGCPNSITPFAPSRAESPAHLFGRGFSKEGLDADPLNRESGGLSREIDLYVLENLQGGKRSSLCTYVELDVDYQSPEYWSGADRYLTYRFWVGEDYNLERATQYRYVIRPEGKGLQGDSWSVDGSHLGRTVPEFEP